MSSGARSSLPPPDASGTAPECSVANGRDSTQKDRNLRNLRPLFAGLESECNTVLTGRAADARCSKIGA